jgi:hypothetical protein
MESLELSEEGKSACGESWDNFLRQRCVIRHRIAHFISSGGLGVKAAIS